MPTHINTIEVSQKEMERGAREESFARLLREWREGKISDEAWGHMLDADKEFRAWLWKLGG